MLPHLEGQNSGAAAAGCRQRQVLCRQAWSDAVCIKGWACVGVTLRGGLGSSRTLIAQHQEAWALQADDYSHAPHAGATGP